MTLRLRAVISSIALACVATTSTRLYPFAPAAFAASRDELEALDARSFMSYKSHELLNTSWQLVRYRTAAGAMTIADEDRTKYTIDFVAEGELRVKLDCNRGRGTWRSKGKGTIDLGALALTRARCPDRSLHDQLVRHWPDVRSYTIKDRHLLLFVGEGAATYEFESRPKQ